MRHGKLLYRALGIHNVAIPGDAHHGRFFVSILTLRIIQQVAGLLAWLCFILPLDFLLKWAILC